MALGEATTIGCFEPGDMPKNYRISNGFITLIDDDLGLNGSKCYWFFFLHGSSKVLVFGWFQTRDIHISSLSEDIIIHLFDNLEFG